MKVNMGTVDRAIRILVAIGIAALYFTDRISGAVARWFSPAMNRPVSWSTIL